MPSPPADVTPEIFEVWRDARRGRVEAEDLSNPYWAWLIRSEVSAYLANRRFGGPSSFGGRPAWSADRFGQTSTRLADGRTVLVAGEHEDYYDPDFFIYNDVIVVEPDGTIAIRGYPEEVFPPTDFHSATLREQELVLIGNLGYPRQRIVGTTPILRLDLETWSVRAQASTGAPPGWIHRHDARLTDAGSAVLVTGGLVHATDDGKLIENIDDWLLRLDGWTWERLTQRRWPRFELARADGRRNDLWEMRQAIWDADHADFWEGSEIGERPSYPMPRDREALEQLYQPSGVLHRVLARDEDPFDVWRIEVEGVIVRYKEGFEEVGVTVEGELPEEIVRGLCDDLLGKLRRVSGVEYVVTRWSR